MAETHDNGYVDDKLLKKKIPPEASGAVLGDEKKTSQVADLELRLLQVYSVHAEEVLPALTCLKSTVYQFDRALSAQHKPWTVSASTEDSK